MTIQSSEVGSALTRSARVDRLYARLDPVRAGRIPVSVTKARSITASFRRTEGMPHVLRCAHAFADVIREAKLFIEPDALLIGAGASHPMGVELTSLWGTWPSDELDALERDGYLLDEDVRAEIEEHNEYWEPRSLTRRMTQTYDDERLWPFAQTGVVLPPFKSKDAGWGAGGLLGAGFGIQHEISQMIGTPDFGRVLAQGLGALEAEILDELGGWRFDAKDSAERLHSLRASLICVRAVQDLLRRYAAIARDEAHRTTDVVWAEELRVHAERLDRLSTAPASGFYDHVQLYWLLYLVMLPSGTLGMGRLDQLFIEAYRRDIDSGAIDPQGALDLLCALRIRSTEITIQGSTAHRSKWAGGSKWHNAVIGGTDTLGHDATNELTFLILKAAVVCPTPHHTLTLRVHKETPEEVLVAALEPVVEGLGMPAFVNDEAVLAYFDREGIDRETARDYNIAGSMSVTLTGASRMVASPMCVVPKILDAAIRGGTVEYRSSGAPITKPLWEHDDFDAFLRDVDQHLEWYLALQAEFNNVTIQSIGDKFPRPLDSVLMQDGVRVGKDVFKRTLPYDNSNFVNVIGVVNAADSLAAIRDCVFEGGVDAKQLVEALDRNWAGPGDADLRAQLLAAPKFGNDDDRADLLAAWLYERAAHHIVRLGNATGGQCKPSALTIGTSPWPGGLVVGATPDGRYAQEPLAEESMTPMRGREHGSPWDVIASASKIDQGPYQTTELDLRFTRDAVTAEGAQERLIRLIGTYFESGGKHLQFNVATERALGGIDTEELVRLGGTSAHWTQLSPSMRDEIRKRHYFRSI